MKPIEVWQPSSRKNHFDTTSDVSSYTHKEPSLNYNIRDKHNVINLNTITTITKGHNLRDTSIPNQSMQISIQSQGSLYQSYLIHSLSILYYC